MWCVVNVAVICCVVVVGIGVVAGVDVEVGGVGV